MGGKKTKPIASAMGGKKTKPIASGEKELEGIEEYEPL